MGRGTWALDDGYLIILDCLFLSSFQSGNWNHPCKSWFGAWTSIDFHLKSWKATKDPHTSCCLPSAADVSTKDSGSSDFLGFLTVEPQSQKSLFGNIRSTCCQKKRMGNTKVQTNCSPFRAHKHVEREPWNLAWCRFDFLAQGQAKGGHGVSYCFKTIKGSILLEVPLPHGNNWWMIQGHMWQPIDHVPSSILLLISWSNRFGVSPELTSNLVDKERRLCARQLSMTSFFQLLTKNR